MVVQNACVLVVVDVRHISDVIPILFQPSNHVVLPARSRNGITLGGARLKICQVLACSNTGCDAGGTGRIAPAQHIGTIKGNFPRAKSGCPVIEGLPISAVWPEIVCLERSNTESIQQVRSPGVVTNYKKDVTLFSALVPGQACQIDTAHPCRGNR